MCLKSGANKQMQVFGGNQQMINLTALPEELKI